METESSDNNPETVDGFVQESEQNEEILEVDHGEAGVNVIPIHLLKFHSSEDVESEILEVEPNGTLTQHLEMVTSHSNSLPFNTKAKGKYSKYYRQTYRTAWESMPDFQGWLKGVKGQPTRAYCTYCKKTLHAHRLSLLKHTCTIKHQKASQLQRRSLQQLNEFGTAMDINNKTIIINDDSTIVSEENDDELSSNIVYATQQEMEENPEPNHVYPDSYLEEHEDPISIEQDDIAIKSEPCVTVPLSTQVTDMICGAPIYGLSVSLYKLVDGRWTFINEGLTDNRGRVSNFFKNMEFLAGRYKLHYDVDRYFEARQQSSLFPFIEIVFDSNSMGGHHFPLLLSPNGYTTYRSVRSE